MLLTSAQLSQAFSVAAERGLLPTSFGSAALRQAFTDSLLKVSMFSARTANVDYLSALKSAVDRLMQGGYGNDLPTLRLELKKLLASMGYDPATGFPGEAHLDIPGAERGSLQDLSSTRRLNFILDTQRRLASGKADQLQGLSPTSLHFAPAWELARVESRKVPRGSVDSGTPGWEERWVSAGGTLTHDPLTGRLRMIALKTDPIWAALGNDPEYDDCLGVSHPPFAFNSGMGWVPVSRGECVRLGAALPDQQPPAITPKTAALQTPPVNLAGVDEDFRKVAEDWFKDARELYGEDFDIAA
jgi:hypothetical protein